MTDLMPAKWGELKRRKKSKEKKSKRQDKTKNVEINDNNYTEIVHILPFDDTAIRIPGRAGQRACEASARRKEARQKCREKEGESQRRSFLLLKATKEGTKTHPINAHAHILPPHSGIR